MGQENLLGRILGERPGQKFEPWAFTPDGLDWRWVSRQLAAERLQRLCGELGTKLGAAGSWSYSPRPAIATLLLDAALLELESSVVATQERPSADGLLVEVDDRTAGRVQPGWRFARRPPEEPATFRIAPGVDKAPERRFCAGDGWSMSFDELDQWVGQVPGGSAEIVVTSADLSRIEERCAWLWVLRHGAALVVCRGEEVPAATGWARPTVLWLSAPGHVRLEQILSFCGGSSDRSKRRALKRLRHVVCVGGEASKELEALCARYEKPLLRLGQATLPSIAGSETAGYSQS